MFSLEGITTSVQDWLFMKFNPTMALAMECVIVILLSISLFALLGLVLVLMERKVAAQIQIRLGPNRVGPGGMFQTVADTLKLIMKEGLVPDKADKFLFNLAPFVVMMVGMLLLAPIAFAKNFQIWDINIGVLYISAVSSLSVIGILMAGWASNNKYSLLGAMRSGAQIVSYELSAGFAVLTIVVLTGSLQLSEIVKAQENGWWIFKGHIPALIAFVLYIIAVTAETNRAPFDLAECDSELIGGYHTEYSSMKLGFYLFAEYINMFISATMISTLYFGSYNFPGMHWVGDHLGHNWLAIIEVAVLFSKIIFFIFFFMWVRWTLPRFRYDQLMHLGWKVLIPLAIINMLITGGWMTYVW